MKEYITDDRADYGNLPNKFREYKILHKYEKLTSKHLDRGLPPSLLKITV